MHQFERSIYVLGCNQRMTTRLVYTKCNNCQTCHQTFLLACQLQIISVATAA